MECLGSELALERGRLGELGDILAMNAEKDRLQLHT